MMNNVFALPPAMLAMMVLFAALLLAAAISDIRKREISNRLNGILAVLGVVWWLVIGLSPWPDMAWRLGAAILVFAAFAGLFAVGAMGGGDVKMAGAMTLWIAPGALLSALMVMAIVGGLLSAIMLIQHRLSKGQSNPEVPYGVAIAAGGLWALHEHYLNQFGVMASV